MKKLLCVVFVVPFISFSQPWAIDEALNKIPRKKEKSIESLCEYIKENSTSDLEKARGAYYWIANNIRYDARRFFKDKASFREPKDVFRKRKAVCEGYAALFYEMCALLNVQCLEVSGYSKGFGYKQGQPLYESDHVWNIVKIGNDWNLFDVTWASGDIHKRMFRKFVPRFTDNYFDVKPKELILTHLPELPMFQLLDYPVPVKVFNSDEKKIYAFLQTPTVEKYNYNDSINNWLADTVNWGMNYGWMAKRFNSENVIPLAYAKINSIDDLLDEYQYRYPDFRWKKDKKYQPFYYYNRLSLPRIDSIINVLNETMLLLKSAKCSRRSSKKLTDETLISAADEISEMYVSKAEIQFGVFKLLRISSVDSLTLQTQPCFESLRKALNVIYENGSKYQFKLLCRELGNKYSLAKYLYIGMSNKETTEEIKKSNEKEYTLFIEDVKNNVPRDCKCYRKIKKW